MTIEDLRYPIGHFEAPAVFSPELLLNYINDIELFPKKLIRETEHLSDEQLNTPYRPGGWTVRQVVNHCADSHMNAIIRHKLALTTHNPTINPYPEALWAEMADSKNMPIRAALLTIEGLHERWGVVLRSLNDEQWKRVFIHPEKGRKFTIQESAGAYAWHANHHLAHITQLKKKLNWQ